MREGCRHGGWRFVTVYPNTVEERWYWLGEQVSAEEFRKRWRAEKAAAKP
jgi:hypothetical protein